MTPIRSAAAIALKEADQAAYLAKTARGPRRRAWNLVERSVRAVAREILRMEGKTMHSEKATTELEMIAKHYGGIPSPQPTSEAHSYQQRVDHWMQHCFGPEITADKAERNHRFLEEALEAVQAGGCTRSEAHQLVDYVFSRDVGEIGQEVGGVMVTLAAFCNAHGLDLSAAAEYELARVWTKSDAIRAKQAAKPKHSPLPEAAPSTPPTYQTAVRLYMIGDTLYAETLHPEGPQQRFMVQKSLDQSWWKEEAPAPEAPAPEALPFSEAAQAECRKAWYRWTGLDLLPKIYEILAADFESRK